MARPIKDIVAAIDTSPAVQEAFFALCHRLEIDVVFYRRIHVKLQQWQASPIGPLTDLLDAMAGRSDGTDV
jgi:hypothetical protein